MIARSRISIFVQPWRHENSLVHFSRLSFPVTGRRYLTQKQMRSPKYRTKVATESAVRDITLAENLSEDMADFTTGVVPTMPNFTLWYKMFTEVTRGADVYVGVEEWDTFIKTYQLPETRRRDAIFGSLMSLATSYKYQKLGNSIRDYFLKTNTPMPIVIAAKYVQLCGRLEGPEREEKVLQAYAELKKLSRLGIFDATTAQTVIDALYRTSQWKECIRLREIIQVLDAVGPTVNGKIVAGAFLHDDPDTAGEFLRVIQTAKQALIPVALIAWYDYACRIGQVEVMKMLEHTRNAEWFIPLEVANKLKARMESQADEDGYRWRGRFTTISMKGECKACGAYLEPITITKEEFLKLRDNFFRLVVETSDVFLRSNPKEVAEFREFVEINAPFDLVIDGLNAAYFQHEAQRVTSRKLAERLRMVVEYVTTRNVGPKKVLVLGRKHMRSWPIDEMRRISRAAKLFYAENISQDDPFLLYAALFSGPQCDFMSSDLMRDHRFKLESKENQDALQKVFLKWQRTHQLQILKVFPDGTVKLKPPMRFDTVAQWTKDSMHIPYESGVPRGLHEIPTNWLCLTKGSADTTRI